MAAAILLKSRREIFSGDLLPSDIEKDSFMVILSEIQM
jgi:hypothetical protein